MIETAYLALGSNLGHRAGNLQRAIDLLLDEGVRVDRVSSVWETAPVPADQPPFLNAVVAATTDCSPAELLAAAKRVETALGRRPERRWGPRPVDIDILFYGETAIETEWLTVPHPLLATRSFVLVPLAELIGGELPGLGVSAAALLEETGTAGLVGTGARLRLPAQS